MCLLHLPVHRHCKPSDSSVYVGFLWGPFSGTQCDGGPPPLQIVDQAFYTGPQWRLALQVGTWGDTEGILFCGFRLHKHHYHLPDLELLGCSAATPILSGALNGGCVRSPGHAGNRVNKKGIFSSRAACRHACCVCLSEGAHLTYVRWLSNLFYPAAWNRQHLSSEQSFLTVPLPDLNYVQH